MLNTRSAVIRDLCKMAKEQIKKSFVDTGTAAMGAGAAPADQAMMGGGGGAPPMDPAMMDPAMAGGGAPPPGDPMAGGGGAPPPGDPMAGPGGPDAIRQIIQQELSAAGIGAKAMKPKPVDERMARVEHLLANIVDFLQIPVSAQEMVDPLGLGPQEQQGQGGGGAGGGMPGGGAGGGGGGEPKSAAELLGELSAIRATRTKAAAVSELLRKQRAVQHAD